jgi:hypothetical protein
MVISYTNRERDLGWFCCKCGTGNRIHRKRSPYTCYGCGHKRCDWNGGCSDEVYMY